MEFFLFAYSTYVCRSPSRRWKLLNLQNIEILPRPRPRCGMGWARPYRRATVTHDERPAWFPLGVGWVV